MPAYAVLDPKARKLFSEERKIPLFKKGTLLYVQLRPKTPDDAKSFAAHLLRPFLKGIQSFVELHQGLPENTKSVVPQLQDRSLDMLRVFATIELQDALYLQLRGTKAPTLSETACKVPALGKDAHSVNHACTLLSEAIEPHRIAHTTNAFKTVYFLRRQPDRLCPLDYVRHDRGCSSRNDSDEIQVTAVLSEIAKVKLVYRPLLGPERTAKKTKPQALPLIAVLRASCFY